MKPSNPEEVGGYEVVITHCTMSRNAFAQYSEFCPDQEIGSVWFRTLLFWITVPDIPHGALPCGLTEQKLNYRA